MTQGHNTTSPQDSQEVMAGSCHSTVLATNITNGKFDACERKIVNNCLGSIGIM